ncbi:MAG: helix-turn-helix domain-containing protein [Cytophagales bacterium]|nr:helix-turn-helix domain-containing protein [Cytophagales bacterium]
MTNKNDPSCKRELRIKLGLEIKRLRKSKGISIRSFETLEGAVDRYTLSKIENGKIMPSIPTLMRICSVLGITLSAFFSGFENDLDPKEEV